MNVADIVKHLIIKLVFMALYFIDLNALKRFGFLVLKYRKRSNALNAHLLNSLSLVFKILLCVLLLKD